MDGITEFILSALITILQAFKTVSNATEQENQVPLRMEALKIHVQNLIIPGIGLEQNISNTSGSSSGCDIENKIRLLAA